MCSKEMHNVIRAAHVVAAANSRYIRGTEHHSSCASWELEGRGARKPCDCGATDFSEALQLRKSVV